MRIILALAALLVAGAYAQVDDSTSVNVARCGERETIPREHDKIVGGVEAKLGDWKWMTILKKSGSFFCGSSLINVGWLVTAAHCTSGQNAALITTEIGLHDRSNPEEWVLVRNIAKIVNHESYGSILMRNDVAVLKLSSPVTYSFYIGPVCLSTPGDDFIHTYAFATGWGTLSSGGQTSQVLREVQLLVRNETDCSKEGGSLVNNDMMICAGLMNDNMDTCQGDSGGPLVVPNPKNGNKWTLIGITSWGQGCGNVGVYCHVQKYFDWIARAVASN